MSRTVVFIDARVPDLQDLVDGVKPGQRVFVLDADRDGLSQIAGILAVNHFTDLEAIHIVSHGLPGEVHLGSTTLNCGTLPHHARALDAVGASLAIDGDILLYGCNVGRGVLGRQFVADLSRATGGTSVAAATHPVGGSLFGGNWDLDVSVGAVASSVPFTTKALADYRGSLAIDGQLWYTILDVPGPSPDAPLGTPARKVGGYFNSDGTSFTQVGGTLTGTITPPITGFTMAVDTAAHLMFIGNTDGLSVSIYNTTTNALLQTIQVGDPNMPGSGDDDVVNGVAIDPINHILFVNRWDSTLDKTGIVKINYNPTSATPVNTAGNANTYLGAQTFLITNQGTGGQITSANVLKVDVATHKLYYTDWDNKYNIAPFTPQNAIYVVDDYTAATPTVTRLTTAAQFPADASNGWIGQVQVNDAKSIVYFTTNDYDNPGQGHLWWMPITGGTATKILDIDNTNLGGGVQAGLSLDPQTQQLYVSLAWYDPPETGAYPNAPTASANHVLKYDVGADGHTFALLDSYTLAQLEGQNPTDDGSHPGASFFNQLPTLTLTGTLTHIGEQSGTFLDLTASSTSSDTDGGYYSGATVQITGGTFSANETSANDDHLSVNDSGAHKTSGTFSGTGIAISYDSAAETLTLSGHDTIARYNTVLAAVEYQTTGDNPTNYGNANTRTVTWTVSDGSQNVPTGNQNSGTTTFTIDAVNDAPNVNTSGGGNSATITANETNAGINQNRSLSIADPDSLTEALTLTDFTKSGPTGGLSDATLQGFFSVPGTVSITQATGSASFNWTFNSGAEAFNFLALGQTLTLNYTIHDVDSNNSNAPSSTALSDDQAISVTITGTNDAPTVTGGATQALTDVSEDSTPSGETVTALLNSHFADLDGGASLAGVAVTSNGTSASGKWQWSTNGSSWSDVGNASDSSAVRVLGASFLRFLPAADFNGTAPALTVHLIDDTVTAFSDGASVNLSGGGATGGTTPYSTATVALTQSVTAVNDAPNVTDSTQSLAAIDEDTADPAGQTVSAVFLNSFSDTDDAVAGGSSANNFDGVAVVGSAASAAQGAWEWFNGATWNSLQSTSAANAVLLAPTTLIRFLPAANFNGIAPALTVRLVDDSGAAFAAGDTVDLTVTGTGDPTRHSAATVMADEAITAVNDIPTLTGLDPATFAENTLNAAAQVIDSAVVFDDIDSPDLNTGTLTVTYTAGGGVQDQLSVLNAVGNITVTGGTTVNFNGNAIGAITTNGVNGADLVVTFNTANATPTAVDALIQALGYANTSHTPALTRTIGITVTDGDGGASTQATALITVNAENDLPLLANVDATVSYREGAGATALDTAPLIVLDDLDAPGVGDQIQSATVTITAGSLAPGDVLSADAGATGINVSYASGVLTLSGNDTLADYEAVLRTVTFTADSQNPTSFGAHPTRTVEWTVTDIDGGSSTAAATTVNIVAPTHFNTLWHNTTTDELRDWTFTNGAVTNNSIIAPPVTAWQVAAIGNFNADGIADIVWHNDSTGDTRVWLMNASGQLASSIAQGSALPNWEVAATGDFNGDGMADIVWQNTANGAARVWLMENGVRTSQIAFSGPDATWFVTGVGDFNGDGTDDILWRNSVDGQLRDWTMANGTFIANTPFVGVSLDQKVAATGDFNNDGTDDIIFHNTTTGDITEWLMSNAIVGTTQSLGNLASDWKLSGAGDYNQDGADDLIWHNSSTGQVVEWVMAAGAQSSTVAIGGTPLDWQVSVNPATHADLLPLV